jgi:hypothetical protein
MSSLAVVFLLGRTAPHAPRHERVHTAGPYFVANLSLRKANARQISVSPGAQWVVSVTMLEDTRMRVYPTAERIPFMSVTMANRSRD